MSVGSSVIVCQPDPSGSPQVQISTLSVVESELHNARLAVSARNAVLQAAGLSHEVRARLVLLNDCRGSELPFTTAPNAPIAGGGSVMLSLLLRFTHALKHKFRSRLGVLFGKRRERQPHGWRPMEPRFARPGCAIHGGDCAVR